MGRVLVAVGVAASACLITAGGARADTGAALPASADAPIEVIEPNAGMSIRVRLLDAAPAAALPASGDAVYLRAIGDADLVRRALDDGIEDFVRYPTRPEREAVTYSVDLQKVAGVRLVSNTVEFLDAEGVPRLRMAPPSITDANGVDHEATVGLEGCSYSTDPRIPWKHAVTPPRSASCVVRVQWSIQSYPAELDPAWTTTISMVVPRKDFALIALTDDTLAMGGITTKGEVTATVEAYRPDSKMGPTKGLWTPVGSLTQPRTHFNAVELPDGTAFIAGGCCHPADCMGCANSAEIFDDAEMTAHGIQGTLSQHAWSTTTVVNDVDDDGGVQEKVVVLGGTQIPSVADVYVVGASSPWQPESPPWSNDGLVEFTATHFVDPKHPGSTGLLVCGGRNASGVAQNTCYARRGGAWGTDFERKLKMRTARYGHTATNVPAGDRPLDQIIIAGGDVAIDGVTKGTADLWTPADRAQDGLLSFPSMMFARRYHAAALRNSGVVIVSGGEVEGRDSVTQTSEGISLGSGTWFSRDNMTYPRSHHRMIRLDTAPEKPLLAVGGRGDGILASAELIAPLPNGSPCNHDAECEDRACTGGICCACPTCHVCDKDGGCKEAASGEMDNRCPEGNDPHACNPEHTCGKDGVCESHDCGLRACNRGHCAPGTCRGPDDCASGAVCLPTSDGSAKCRCTTSSACTAGFTCASDGQCRRAFVPDNTQISCALAEPAAGVAASMLICAAALAARRRRQSGKDKKACGSQSKNEP